MMTCHGPHVLLCCNAMIIAVNGALSLAFSMLLKKRQSGHASKTHHILRVLEAANFFPDAAMLARWKSLLGDVDGGRCYVKAFENDMLRGHRRDRRTTCCEMIRKQVQVIATRVLSYSSKPLRRVSKTRMDLSAMSNSTSTDAKA